MAKSFNKQEIDMLSKSPYVKHVRENRLTFTYEFRLILWEYWVKNPSIATIRNGIEQHDLNISLIGYKLITNIHHNFQKNGKPSGGTNKTFGKIAITFKSNQEDNEFLVNTGKFIIKGKGIVFHPDFINELYTEYPNQSIEGGLIKVGIDPEIVGYQRIYNLKQLFDGKSNKSQKMSYSDDIIAKYKNHPYVKRITNKQFVLNDNFYNEAYILKSLNINKILNVFEIENDVIGISVKNNIYHKLNGWNKIDCEPIVSSNSDLLLKISKNYNEQLEILVQSNFDAIKEVVPTLSNQQRKLLCEWIQLVPSAIKKGCGIRGLLDKVGISKSSYYSILKNDDYGKYELEKQFSDDNDVLIIKQVVEYKGYPKGSRMIYMMMKSITGKQFGLNKIRRLMKKYELTSGVRKPNPSRRKARELLKRNVKPNVLKRKFKIEKPLTTFVTDVSYLKYGNNQTTYLSVIKDASSGVIVACVISESNDLNLVLDTLEQFINFIENHKYLLNKEALLHSDQGILYLSDTFQNKVKLLNLIQSMSRRGNCWDNASQESYFGHFKDECIFKDCNTFEELQVMVDDYVYYYNNERPQWDRMKMTPIAFEKHLLSMSEIEFEKYQDKEIDKYNKMMERAKEKAKKRAVDMGVNINSESN